MIRSIPSYLCLLALLSSATAADWEPITDDLVKAEKPGAFGLCGVFVDHATGKIYVNLSDRGFYVSADQGKTWDKVNKQPIKGRTEWPGCFLFDPTGKSKKFVAALVYGAPITVSTDGGENWSAMHGKSGHVDWCAVDWTDPETKFVLTLKHESGDLLMVSRDGGKTFEDIGKGYGPAWIFDDKTAVVVQTKTKDRPAPKILRTTDAGKTWEPVADYSAKALPKLHDGVLYWLVDGAVISSADKGKTWEKKGDLKDGRYGPIFGKDAKQMFVLTGAGIIESTDGGATWSKPLAPPKDFKGVNMLTWIDYDPKSDTVYLMKMASPLYRMKRGG